jgi:hypothetical protein
VPGGAVAYLRLSALEQGAHVGLVEIVLVLHGEVAVDIGEAA